MRVTISRADNSLTGNCVVVINRIYWTFNAIHSDHKSIQFQLEKIINLPNQQVALKPNKMYPRKHKSLSANNCRQDRHTWTLSRVGVDTSEWSLAKPESKYKLWIDIVYPWHMYTICRHFIALMSRLEVATQCLKKNSSNRTSKLDSQKMLLKFCSQLS